MSKQQFMRRPARRVTLYTRPGCHLCEDAFALLERIGGQMALEVFEVNILDDLNLFERYKHAIPVIAIEGGPTLAAPIREDELTRILTG